LLGAREVLAGDEHHAGKYGGFEDSEEDAGEEEGGVGFGEAMAGGYEAPG